MTDGLFHIGLRIIKTGLAVFLSLLITHLFNGEPFYAVIAAVICLRQTSQDSYHIGAERVIGTIIGGVFGIIMLSILKYSPLQQNEIGYDIILCLGLMLLIKLISLLGRGDAVSIACVVYLSLLVIPMGKERVLSYAIGRIMETLIGVILAVSVNYLLPHHRLKEKKR